MTTLLPDLRFALRLLRKSPGFTIAAFISANFGRMTASSAASGCDN
jgi:hypothetical protein